MLLVLNTFIDVVMECNEINIVCNFVPSKIQHSKIMAENIRR